MGPDDLPRADVLARVLEESESHCLAQASPTHLSLTPATTVPQSYLPVTSYVSLPSPSEFTKTSKEIWAGQN